MDSDGVGAGAAQGGTVAADNSTADVDEERPGGMKREAVASAGGDVRRVRFGSETGSKRGAEDEPQSPTTRRRLEVGAGSKRESSTEIEEYEVQVHEEEVDADVHLPKQVRMEEESRMSESVGAASSSDAAAPRGDVSSLSVGKAALLPLVRRTVSEAFGEEEVEEDVVEALATSSLEVGGLRRGAEFWSRSFRPRGVCGFPTEVLFGSRCGE